MKLPLAALTCGFLAMFLTSAVPAAASDTTSVDLSTTLSTFASASGSYGPLTEQDLQIRFGPTGAFGIGIADRNARGTFSSTHTQNATIDVSHQWSPRFTSYAALGTGSGPPYPSRQAYLQGETLIAKGVTVLTGAGTSFTVGTGQTRSLKFGATYYRGDGYAALTYTPAWSQTLGSMQGYLFSLALGHPGNTTETFYVGTGSEGDISLQNPANTTIIGERETGVAVSVKHWLTPSFGFRVGAEVGRLYRVGGPSIYARRSITLGLFSAPSR